MYRRGFVAGQRCPPALQRFEQRTQTDSAKICRARRQILVGALQQRVSANEIPRRMMMKGNRSLDQPLQKSLLQAVRFPPYIFPNFMGVVELAGVEKPDAFTIAVRIQSHVPG